MEDERAVIQRNNPVLQALARSDRLTSATQQLCFTLAASISIWFYPGIRIENQ
jgi:hypothetical protein